jgi:hypothetical protein
MSITLAKRSALISAELERVKKVAEKRIKTPADKLTRSHLAKLAEEMCIPTKELNLLAKSIISRSFGDYRYLTSTECRKVEKYLKANYNELAERYRRMRWA